MFYCVIQKRKKESKNNYFHLDKLSIPNFKKKYFMNKNMVVLNNNQEKTHGSKYYILLNMSKSNASLEDTHWENT